MALANPAMMQELDYVMNSPLLFDLLRHWDEEKHYVILDPLPVHPSVLNVFADIRCKLFLPGCFNDLLAIKLDEEQSVAQLQEQLRSQFCLVDSDCRLDLVLLWDLPNYADRRVLYELIQLLLPWMKPNAVIHTYIHTQRQIPETSSLFQFWGVDKVRVSAQSSQMIDSPCYYQEALEQIVEPFTVRKSVLLSSGLQEYLLELK